MSDRPAAGDMPLKALTRDLIESAGGLEAAAACLRGRVGRSQLANYQSPHHDQFIPVDVACRLAQVTGEVRLIAELAGRLGYRLAPLDTVAPGCAVQAVAAVMQEVNEAAQALSLGMADGDLSSQDLEKVESELLDVARVATERASSVRGAKLHLAVNDRGAA